jgi:serine beta-lactamase-like protein LACTB
MRSITLCLLLTVATQAIAQSEIQPPKKYADAVGRIEKLVLQELDGKQLPALSIAIIDDQTTAWAKGFGFADAAKKIPATAETVYRVGSVSKLFTDIGVMQLVEAGKLDLDAPVTRYLPSFTPKNPFEKPITLRQLMTHRAGLVREPSVGSYFDNANTSLEKTITSLNSTELLYPPESKVKYSNAGIAAVGYVVEKTKGQAFGRYLKSAVLTPLGLTNSSFEPEPEIKQKLAQGLMWTLHARQFPAPTFELGMSPAACMYSSVLDLGQFMKVLAAGGAGPGGQVVSQRSLDEMWKPQFAAPGQKDGIGLGFFVSQRNGHRRVGHNGAMYGFATELAYLPDDKIGAVVTISCDCANPVAERIANFAIDCILAARDGKPLPDLVTTQPVTESWLKFADGNWNEPKSGQTMRIDALGKKLLLLPGRGGMRVELRQLGDDLIVDDRLGFGTRIKRDGDGFLFNGRRWIHQEDSMPPDAPEKWAGLIGEYGPDHDILTILEWNGRLTALIEWFFIYPLTEISENVYQFPNFGLYQDEKLIFERDSAGRATKVTAANVPFIRRHLDGEDGKTFRIKSVRQLDGLRKEALAASPPPEAGDRLKPDLVDLATVDPTIKFDIRYATDNNFLSTPFYTTARAFMQRPAAEAVGRVQKNLASCGYGLLIHDAYRPWYVTKMFWDATPERFHNFVADPMQGSRHNRGCAADLTLYDLKTGKPIRMVGGYDEFSDRSYPDYFGGTTRQRWHRDVLRRAMEAEGFTVYEAEWWHFDFKDWRQYPILNKRFEDLNQ